VDSKKEIHNLQTGTFMKVLSAEAYSKHGLNPSVVIFDELHAQPTRDLWDTMFFGAGSARREPLLFVITTAGDDPDRTTIGWEIHEQARKIDDGVLIDPTWYTKLYGAPEDADIFDEQVWFKANPSLGVTIDIETVRKEATAAKNSEPTERLFRWLRLNQWVSLKRTGWLPLTLWDSTEGDWSLSDLLGKYCYIGLDLSSTTDITALALLFPPQKGLEGWRCIFKAYIPLENMKERIRRDKVPYDAWEKAGYLTATEGNAVDYETVQMQIETFAKQYKVKFLCADKWNSEMMRQKLKKKGLDSIVIEQTMAGLSPGMKEIERTLRTGEMTHLNNPVARWCFGNIIIATDGNENIKPMKNKSLERIDLIVALITTMAAAMKLESKISAYEEHGIRMA
jgi:phage terminase large subunit-like protein